MSFFLSSQGVRIKQEPASFAARLGAFALDMLIMISLFCFLAFINGCGVFDFMNEDLLFLMLIMLPYSYPLVSETMMDGQTLGKRVLKIRVVTLEGGGPKMSSLILRWLMLPFDIILAMGIGQLCIFFTKRQQRLGDIVAGTWVVRTQEYKKASIMIGW